MTVPSSLIITLFLIQSISPYALLNPKIDLIDLKADTDTANKWCQATPCPIYKINPTRIPRPFEARDYQNGYWLSTPWYPETNGSCLADVEKIAPYYANLLNYFEGLNAMGLRFERTRPVRIVSRKNLKDNNVMCCIRFFVPDMYPMHPPAAIVLDVIIGWDIDRTCYVVGKKGKNTWENAKKIDKSMRTYLTRLERRFSKTPEVTVDIFSGFGVSKEKQFMEVLVCLQDSY